MSRFTLDYYTCFFGIFIAASLFLLKRKKLPYPPGPKGALLMGNIFDLPPSSHWITYAEWSRKFHSDVIYLNLLGSHLLVVNSLEAASDLFEKRSAIYSDRPSMPMLELAGWDWTFGLFKYGKKWMFHRRLFHQYFNSRAVRSFEPQERKATHELLHRLVHTPEDFMSHIRLMAASVILSIAYGIDVQSADDPFVVSAEKALQTVTIAGNPGSFLVDTFPLLKYVPEWMPGAGFKRLAREWRKCIQDTADVPLQFVKDQMENGVHTTSVASLCLKDLGGNAGREMEEAIRGVTGSIYGAGSDTTVSTLCSFVLEMVLHPEFVKKAQEELDRVVGRDRLPDFSDIPSLPYIGALVKESLRLNPVSPFGLPHRLMVDDVYNGRFMPAGAIVMGNIWAMLHSESDYPEPEKFNPDRFLKVGEIDPNVRSPEDAAFGFGRRICPGKDFALSSLFINIACILSVFDIGRAVGEDGSEIIPSGEYSIGFTCRPMPFQCSIKPRSPQALNLITEAYAVHHP